MFQTCISGRLPTILTRTANLNPCSTLGHFLLKSNSTQSGRLALTFDAVFPRMYKELHPQEYSVTAILDRIPDRKEMIAEVSAEIKAKRDHATAIGKRKIVVVGDSHAVDVSKILGLLLPDEEFQSELIHSLCDPLARESIKVHLNQHYESHGQSKVKNPEYCEQFHEGFLQTLKSSNPDLIVFSEAWRDETIPLLEDTIQRIEMNLPKSKILILGRIIHFNGDPKIAFKRAKAASEINEIAWERRKKKFDHMDKELNQIALATNSGFISKYELVCPNQKCDILLGDEIGFVDQQHWSKAGFFFYGKRLVSHQEFLKLTR